MPELSPTLYESKAIIISSDSESESEGRKTPPDLATNQQHGTHHDNHNHNHNHNPNLTPVRTRNTMNDNNHSSEHQTMSAHDNAARALAHMDYYDYTVLDHATTSPLTPNPPITVMLVLTPQPAILADQAAFEDFGARFSEDFSNVAVVEKTWSVVSLYGHYRAWARRSSASGTPSPGESPVPGAWPCENPNVVGQESTATAAAPASPPHCDTTDDEKAIGNIHPSSLLSKLEQGIDVHWRFFIPVLQQLIEREVKNGTRSIIVGGLKMGDIAGIRAFAQKVSSPPSMPASCITRPDDADPSMVFP